MSHEIFGCDIRPDILHRVVTWQRANKRQNTHFTKTKSTISYIYIYIYMTKNIVVQIVNHGIKKVLVEQEQVIKDPIFGLEDIKHMDQKKEEILVKICRRKV